MSSDVPAHFFLVLCLVASRILPGGPVVQRPHDVPFCPDYARTICPVWIGARSSRFGMGVMDRRFSRAPIPMKGDRYALVAVRQRTTSVYDRPASVFRDEGGPTPAFSGAAGKCVNRHGWRHGTTDKNRAQPRGRASGVRCKAMLGGFLDAEPNISLCEI